MQKNTEDLIGYDEIIEKSMRNVIFESFKKIMVSGLPGRHHFIISFVTKFPGVELPQNLLQKYPEEITIVIQHQYKNMVVESDLVKLSLSFAGHYEKIAIPYAAITSFSDPSTNFCLRFNVSYENINALEFDDYDNSANQDDKYQGKSKLDIDLSAKVISLDAFRKNKNNND